MKRKKTRRGFTMIDNELIRNPHISKSGYRLVT